MASLELPPMAQPLRQQPLSEGAASDRAAAMDPDRVGQLRSATAWRSSSGYDQCAGRNEVLNMAVREIRAPVHKKMFFYDHWRRLLPSRLAANWSRRDTLILDRLKRTEVWAKYGRAMSLWTLEFLDAEVEMDYQKDATRRLKRWVRYALAIACAYNSLMVVQRVVRIFLYLQEGPCKDAECDLFWNACASMAAAGLYGAQLAQFRLDRDFVLRNFQDLLLVWSILQACAALICAFFSARDKIRRNPVSAGQLEPESPQEVMMMTLLVYKNFRAIYFFILAVVVICGYALLNHSTGYYLDSATDHELLLITAIGFTCMTFYLELLQRKDYVQAIASWRESIRTELLLHNILPEPIINQLKERRGAISQSYDQVSIFFADVVSFTTMSAQVTPAALVELLNRMFRKIDQLADKNGVEKVKTIGDCYMAAAGLPSQNTTHAQAMARFGLQMLSMMRFGHLRNPATDEPLQVRIGIHSGPCVAGVIGHKKFAYDIWGDAVNTAARMESHGEPMRLHCSGDTHTLLRDDFVCEPREPMTVKGKGLMQTYFVIEEHPSAQHKSFVNHSWVTNLTSGPSSAAFQLQQSVF